MVHSLTLSKVINFVTKRRYFEIYGELPGVDMNNLTDESHNLKVFGFYGGIKWKIIHKIKYA